MPCCDKLLDTDWSEDQFKITDVKDGFIGHGSNLLVEAVAEWLDDNDEFDWDSLEEYVPTIYQIRNITCDRMRLCSKKHLHLKAWYGSADFRLRNKNGGWSEWAQGIEFSLGDEDFESIVGDRMWLCRVNDEM